MSDLTAIDILINPDEKTLERARAVNARLRQSVPSGFELDATHLPHITILQRYVRTADLEKVYEAIQTQNIYLSMVDKHKTVYNPPITCRPRLSRLFC
jgi:hypothetical protein